MMSAHNFTLYASKQKATTTACFASEQKLKYFHSKDYKFSCSLSLNNAFTVYEETATFIRDFWRVIGIWMVFCKKEQQGLSARKHVNNLPISKKPLFTRRKFPKSVYSTAHGSLTEVPSHEYLSTNLATSKVNL